MNDYYYIGFALLIMGMACTLQYQLGKREQITFLLPMAFGIGTFWLGLISLLFAFVLVFVGEFGKQHFIEKI